MNYKAFLSVGVAVLLSSASAYAQTAYQPNIGSGVNTAQPAYGLMAQGSRTGVAGGSLGGTIPALSVPQIQQSQQAVTPVTPPTPQDFTQQQYAQVPAPTVNEAPVYITEPTAVEYGAQPVAPQNYVAQQQFQPIIVDPAYQNAPAVNVTGEQQYAQPQFDMSGFDAMPADAMPATMAPTPMVQNDYMYDDGSEYETQVIQVPVPIYQQPAPVPAQPTPMAASPINNNDMMAPLPDVGNGYATQGNNGIDPSIMPSPMFTPSARTTQSMNPQPYADIPAQPGLMFEIDDIDDMGSETLITRKISDMRSDLNKLQDAIAIAKEQLENLRYSAELQAADYYAVVAAIQARLQAGTTPGNPRLVNSWNVAQDRLDRLSEDVDSLGDLASKVAAQANMGSFLLEATRATYGLSGALESDHANLEVLEDDVTNTVMVINRLLNETTDDINRRTAYLATERKNLQTLAVGVSKGELFGRSLTNQYFQRVMDPMSLGGIERLRAEGKRPLAVIRFNQDQVNYSQPVYAALNDAIRKNPDAEFELIAVTPNEGTSAEIALASTDSKNKAEDVVRTLSNMGLPNTKMQVSSAMSAEANSPEVHIYIR